MFFIRHKIYISRTEKKINIKVEAYPKPAADHGECKVSVSEMVAQVNTRHVLISFMSIILHNNIHIFFNFQG